MIGYELSEEDKALVACFEEGANSEGFDGIFSLPPVERGVLAVAELVRTRTLFQVFTALGMHGSAAAEVAFSVGRIVAPASPEEVRAKLRDLYQ